MAAPEPSGCVSVFLCGSPIGALPSASLHRRSFFEAPREQPGSCGLHEQRDPRQAREHSTVFRRCRSRGRGDLRGPPKPRVAGHPRSRTPSASERFEPAGPSVPSRPARDVVARDRLGGSPAPPSSAARRADADAPPNTSPPAMLVPGSLSRPSPRQAIHVDRHLLQPAGGGASNGAARRLRLDDLYLPIERPPRTPRTQSPTPSPTRPRPKTTPPSTRIFSLSCIAFHNARIMQRTAAVLAALGGMDWAGCAS
jgi:hypothetical protein